MAIEIEIINSADGLRAIYSDIHDLFGEAFGKPLDESNWSQYYLANPYGSPIVVLAYEDDRLIGHCGLVPQVLLSDIGAAYKYHLMMTLMVSPKWQGTGTFSAMMDQLLNETQNIDSDFLLAFLNQNSIFPLTQKYNWRCLIETSFYRLSVGTCLLDTPNVRANVVGLMDLDDVQLRVPYRDTKYMKWRSMANDYWLVSLNSTTDIIYKFLNSTTLDVIDVISKGPPVASLLSIGELAQHLECDSIMVTGYHASIIGIAPEILEPDGDYKLRMCALPLFEGLPNNINLSLLMSDVY